MPKPSFLKPTRKMKAKTLLMDDWFRMAGSLYRIDEVTTFDDNQYTEIIFHNAFRRPEKLSQLVLRMTVPSNTKFKIYNQR